MKFSRILAVAAAEGRASSAGPVVGPELWVQPTFAASTSLTLGGWTFATGSVTSNDSTFLSATALGTLTAGTYRITYTVLANDNSANLQINVGGAVGDATATPGTVGPHTVDKLFSSITTQVIRFRDALADTGLQISAFSVKQIT